MHWEIPKGFKEKVFEEMCFHNLSEEQKKFLTLIMERGVIIRLKKRENKENEKDNSMFIEFIELLKKMHKDGIIPHLEIIQDK